MKRAERRHHIRRLIAKRKNYWGSRGGSKSPTHLRMLANTPTPCSCHMCRNARSSAWLKGKERLTIQERRLQDINSLVIEAMIEIEKEIRESMNYNDYFVESK